MAGPLLRSRIFFRALASFDKAGVEENFIKKRFIMTTRSKLDKVLETLQKNPYYDKYAEKIAKLQQTSPEEFLQRVEEQEKKVREKEVSQNAYKLPSTCSSWLRTSLLRKSSTFQERIIRRQYSSNIFHDFYVTTPIFYVNAGPHIGHLYSVALADAISRYNSMLGHNVYLSTGTDEHGTKVQTAAEKTALTTAEYCDNMSYLFRDMCDKFNINYSRFIRTTDQEHRETVHRFWNILEEKGHIYLGKYSGWYCASDEAFLAESELDERKLESGKTIKVSKESGHPVEWTEEDNFKFRLSAFQDDLRHWLKDENTVRPSKYHKILSRWIEEGVCLQDLSISRPNSRMPWGIPTPNDNSQNIYVWLDALVNYLSTLGYPSSELFQKVWPPSVQIIGKDILKFHGIYWPAFLIAAGLEPPRTLLCHSHWLVNSEKMSKSKHNVVSPFAAAEKFTAEGLRYFLLREAVPTNDANYDTSKVTKILNSELANTFGNLVNRCTGRKVNPRQEIPNPREYKNVLDSSACKDLIDRQTDLSEFAQSSYERYNLHHVVDATMSMLHCTNQLVNHHEPWKLVKRAESIDELRAVIAISLESARIASLVLQPIIPERSNYVLDFLGVPKEFRTWADTETRYTRNLYEETSCGSAAPIMLFRTIIHEKESAV